MSNSSPNTSGVRSKLEFPVWYRGFARSYIAWANAPSDLKTPLLLQGPALAQAENWLLTHPDKLSESQKRFIVRSIALRAKGPSAPQPEAQVVRRSGGRWRRSSDRSLWHLYAVIAVGLWVFSPDLLRDLMERSLNRPEAYEELRRRRLSPSAPPPTTVAGTDVPSSQAPAPAAPGKDAATVAKAPLGDIDETPPLTFPIATADTRAVRLTALAREKQEAGQSRTALLLGIEATVEAIEEEPDGGKKTVVAAGLLMRTMATRETLGTLVHRSAIARTTLFCNDARALLAITGEAALSVYPAGGARRSLGVELAGTTLDGIGFDLDCRRFLLPNEDFNVEVRPLSGGTTTTLLVGHEASILASSFSPDGSTVLTASQDSTARLWDARNGRQRQLLSGHDWHVTGAEFSSDGRRVLTASSDMTARIWDVATGRQLHVLAGHQGVVGSARFSRDGARILTTAADGTARIWDAVGGKPLHTLRLAGGISTAELGLDGRRVATADSDGGLQLWDAGSGEQLHSVPGQGEGNGIRALSFVPGGRGLVVLTWAGLLALHDAQTGVLVNALTSEAQRVRAFQLGERGRTLVAVTEDGVRLTWPITMSPIETLAHAKAIAPPCLTADERTMLGVNGDAPGWCSEIRPRGAALP